MVIAGLKIKRRFMKTLYIAATAFQLITILNIRVNMKTQKGDLILHEKSIPNSHYIKDRVIESGLFNNVYLFKDYDSRLNSVFIGKNSLADYLKIVYKKHFSRMDINDFLIGEGKVDLEKVNEVFCFNKKFLNIIEKYVNIKINFIDEGVGSYTSGTINASDRIEKIYLYKPKLAVYYEKYKDKFVTIPTLDAKDVEFRNLLNRVWGYEDIIKIENNTVLIFDQPWRITPKYFYSFPVAIRENVLVKSKVYKKYDNDEKAKNFFVNAIKKLQLNNKNVVVKMHPRSSVEMKKYYEAEGLKVLDNTAVPWEIVFLNLKVNNICLVSMFSTVTLSLGIYFNNSNVSYISVFLYKLASEEGVEVPKEIIAFLGEISKKLKSVRVLVDREEFNAIKC